MDGVLIEARGGDRYRVRLPDGSSVEVASAEDALALAESGGLRRAFDKLKHPRARGGLFADVPDHVTPPKAKAKPRPQPRVVDRTGPRPGSVPDQTGLRARAKDVPASKLKEVPKEGPAPKKGAPTPKKEEPLGSPGRPIETDDVVVAAKELAAGRYVQLSSKPQVSTLLRELKREVDAAKEKGDRAPDINLCKVTVKGTSLFCVESKGIPRIEMPQLKGQPTPGSKADELPRVPAPKGADKGEVDLSAQFRDHLVRHGVRVEDGEELASHLKATQNELVGAKVAGIAGAMDEGVTIQGGGLFVSQDNYIVDGHHRWAATVAVDYEDGKDDMKMSVQRIDRPIVDILLEANEFAEDWGIAQKSGKTNLPPAPPLPDEKGKKVEEAHRTPAGMWRVRLPDGRLFDHPTRELAEASLRVEWKKVLHPRGRAGRFVDTPDRPHFDVTPDGGLKPSPRVPRLPGPPTKRTGSPGTDADHVPHSPGRPPNFSRSPVHPGGTDYSPTGGRPGPPHYASIPSVSRSKHAMGFEPGDYAVPTRSFSVRQVRGYNPLTNDVAAFHPWHRYKVVQIVGTNQMIVEDTAGVPVELPTFDKTSVLRQRGGTDPTTFTRSGYVGPEPPDYPFFASPGRPDNSIGVTEPETEAGRNDQARRFIADFEERAGRMGEGEYYMKLGWMQRNGYIEGNGPWREGLTAKARALRAESPGRPGSEPPLVGKHKPPRAPIHAPGQYAPQAPFGERLDAARRNARDFGTDPSWYGIEPGQMSPGRPNEDGSGDRLERLYDAMVRAGDRESDEYDPERHRTLKAQHDKLYAEVFGELGLLRAKGDSVRRGNTTYRVFLRTDPDLPWVKEWVIGSKTPGFSRSVLSDAYEFYPDELSARRALDRKKR